MRAALSVFLVAPLLTLASPATAQEGDERERPTSVRVPSTIDARGRDDVTEELNGFFAEVPDGSFIVFPRGGRYRVEGTLLLEDRNGLTFVGNGSEVFATTPGPARRPHFEFTRGSEIAVRQLRVRGANPKAGLAKEAYDREREFQHGLMFRGTKGVVLDQVVVTDVYGDFVYLGADVRGNREWTTDVLIRNSQFERNGRQGIAITAAEEVVIEANRLVDTRMNVIDIEPNDGQGGAIQVRIDGNEAVNWNNYFLAIGGKGRVTDVSAGGNQLSGRFLSVLVKPPRVDEAEIRSDISILDNTSDTAAPGAPVQITGLKGGTVRGNEQALRRAGPAVVLVNSCDVEVADNEFSGATTAVERKGDCDDLPELTISAAGAAAPGEGDRQQGDRQQGDRQPRRDQQDRRQTANDQTGIRPVPPEERLSDTQLVALGAAAAALLAALAFLVARRRSRPAARPTTDASFEP